MWRWDGDTTVNQIRAQFEGYNYQVLPPNTGDNTLPTEGIGAPPKLLFGYSGASKELLFDAGGTFSAYTDTEESEGLSENDIIIYSTDSTGDNRAS